MHGGSGAVGIFAIQLARFRGARITATASARNLEFVSALGADRVIDYHTEHFEENVSGMDVVFDTVGGETLQRSWGVLKPGGRMITIAADNETTTDNRVKQAFFIVEPNHEHLIRIGDLLESGDLLSVVDAVLPLTAGLRGVHRRSKRETGARKARGDGRTCHLRRGDEAGPVQWKTVRIGSLNALFSTHHREPSPRSVRGSRQFVRALLYPGTWSGGVCGTGRSPHVSGGAISSREWEYQLFYQEYFARATAVLEANIYNTVKLFFRKGNPAGQRQPSATARVRSDGGWFNGAEAAPALPRDPDVVTEEDLCAYTSALERNGFLGPNVY